MRRFYCLNDKSVLEMDWRTEELMSAGTGLKRKACSGQPNLVFG